MFWLFAAHFNSESIYQIHSKQPHVIFVVENALYKNNSGLTEF